MTLVRQAKHVFSKVTAAIGLMVAAAYLVEWLAPWPGLVRLAGWVVFAALLQVVFHQPYPPKGRSRFVFSTAVVILGGCCVVGATLLESMMHPVLANPRFSSLGDLLFLVGTGLRFAALQALGGLFHWNIRVVEGHQLVTSGVFRHIRHPSYAGLLLMGLAAPLVANAYWSFLAFPILLLSILVRIHYEEKALRDSLPGYSQYASKTARLIPRIY